MLISILTPTFNREYRLTKLYESLLIQNDKKFEWIIIDDGSEDKTKEFVEKLKKENKIKIEYVYKKNGGKHTAINLGINYCKGNILAIVDSDDYLIKDAVKNIRKYSKDIYKEREFCGLCFRKKNILNKKPFKKASKFILDKNLQVYRAQEGIKEDLFECFFLSEIKKNRFPEIKDEKFCPEGLIWNRITKNKKLRFIDKEIYICEYLSDGYSQNYKKLRRNNPKAYLIYYYEEILNKDISLKRKFCSSIRLLETLWYYLKK